MELNSRRDDEALEAILRRVCTPPQLPAGFRARLQARLQADGAEARARALLEQEWRSAQQQLQRESVRLRWQTLLWLLGGAFAAGALTTAAMPWVADHLGAQWRFGVPVGVAMLGMLASWIGDPRVRRFLANISAFGA